jgi:membrane protein YdbS with pleckstrin-like domain
MTMSRVDCHMMAVVQAVPLGGWAAHQYYVENRTDWGCIAVMIYGVVIPLLSLSMLAYEDWKYPDEEETLGVPAGKHEEVR